MMTLITGFTCPPTIYFKFITKWDKCYYKVRQFFLLQSATAFLLQSATSIITKCDRYYKVRRLLQSATVHPLAHPGHYRPISVNNKTYNKHLSRSSYVGARQQLWVFVRTTFCRETRGKNWSSYEKKNLNPQIIKYINMYTIACHIGEKQVLTTPPFLSVPYYNSHLMVVCKVGYLIAVCLIDILINISSWYWARNIY